jgi:hypothetical protein
MLLHHFGASDHLNFLIASWPSSATRLPPLLALFACLLVWCDGSPRSSFRTTPLSVVQAWLLFS